MSGEGVVYVVTIHERKVTDVYVFSGDIPKQTVEEYVKENLIDDVIDYFEIKKRPVYGWLSINDWMEDREQ